MAVNLSVDTLALGRCPITPTAFDLMAFVCVDDPYQNQGISNRQFFLKLSFLLYVQLTFSCKEELSFIVHF